MAKTRTVNIDGFDYTLASLSMDQVEEFWDDPKGDIAAIRSRSWKNILYSLNNAGSDITLDQLKCQLSLKGYEEIHDIMLEVSYLKRDAEGEPQTATSQLTSSSSGAV